jgi:ubiquinone/menaquinone biosynthesis C-methylase UbiE
MNAPFEKRSAAQGYAAGMPDFGYPWWISFGHLIVLAIAIAALALIYALRGPKWLAACVGLVGVWALSAFIVMQTGLNLRARAQLPTQSFLASGTGRVLDLGAGTGRSSLMVLEARPKATLVALDLFGESFDQHFGPGETPRQLLKRNLQAAGVLQRASVVAADMRQLPFENSSFDAVTSSYAIDHLRRDDAQKALVEAARVTKPGGDLLILVVAKDGWLNFAFGPLLLHSGMRKADWWVDRIGEAGFRVMEHGTQPGTIWVYAKLPSIG